MSFLDFEPFSNRESWNRFIQRPINQGLDSGHERLETETEIVNLLRVLSLIVQSVGEIHATNIRPTVNVLQYHWSRKVTEAALKTTNIFKRIIKDCDADYAALSERSSECPESSTLLDENALPIPPMDEGALVCTMPPSELLTFFEELDEDGNPKVSNETEKPHESKKRRIPTTQEKNKMEVQQPTNEGSASIRRNKLRKRKQQQITIANNSRDFRPSHNSSGVDMIHGRQRKSTTTENNRKVELPLRQELSESFPIIKHQKSALKEPNEKTNSLENDIKTQNKNDKKKAHDRSNSALKCQASDLDEKLEISKKKLHQRYQAHEKRRRIIKYIPDIQPIPRDASRSSKKD
ncbi:probable mediator of RNA polymerase II transcription subunit 26b isoform X2 [Arachis stenosperma]|uniref:probable mediator of RNA polymerase II transcription subunit 26b isoform X2 n=1 Tax=Arachis stenosperma TaxID=217475 RepID=UPI0025AB878C|nr:probable mediator of RNA polymerase II transcription subunit 26b isoform X2 [Arachis stenosperma]